MENKKITDVLLDRIKYFINALENGEYDQKDMNSPLKSR